MTLRNFLVLTILLSFFYFLFTSSVLAQGTTQNDFLGVQDFTVQKIAAILAGFACWLIGIVLAIMVIALVIAGIRFFLARGNDAAVADAKKNLTWTLVGILVILATNVIIATVANALGGDYSFIPLNCGPIGEVTSRVRGSCTGPADCPTGYTCVIEAGQTRGYCYNF